MANPDVSARRRTRAPAGELSSVWGPGKNSAAATIGVLGTCKSLTNKSAHKPNIGFLSRLVLSVNVSMNITNTNTNVPCGWLSRLRSLFGSYYNTAPNI